MLINAVQENIVRKSVAALDLQPVTYKMLSSVKCGHVSNMHVSEGLEIWTLGYRLTLSLCIAAAW